eukprot:1831314-Pyramimonas_sp.AAC.1
MVASKTARRNMMGATAAAGVATNAPSRGKSRVCYAYSRGPQNCDRSCGREHRPLTKQEKRERDAWEQSLQKSGKGLPCSRNAEQTAAVEKT